MFFTKKETFDVRVLREHFDRQAEILRGKGYPGLLAMDPEAWRTALEKLWQSLEGRIAGIKVRQKGGIPLLLVAQQVRLQDKITLLRGHTELDLENIPRENPTRPFSLLLDVEDGEKMVAVSPKDALKKLEKGQRSALTIHESIALLTQVPSLLKNHYLISAGSFYKKDDETLPLLWLLDEHGNPELHYAWFHIAHGSYGTASYAVKIQ